MRPSAVAAALSLMLALTGCASVPDEIKAAEPLACPTPCASDPVVAVGPGGQLEVEAFDLGFTPTELFSNEGEIAVTLVNVGAGLHDFSVEGGAERIAEASGGQESEGTVALFSGEYVFYCSVPGHRAGGMEGTLTILAADEPLPTGTEVPSDDATEDSIGEGASPEPTGTGDAISPSAETTEAPSESES